MTRIRSQKQISLRDIQNVVAQDVAHAGQGGHADDHAHAGAGDAEGDGFLAAVHEGGGNLLPGHAGFLFQRGDDQHQNDAHQGGKGDGVLADDEIDHRGKGNQQMPPALHSRPDAGQLLLGHAVEPQLLAAQVHGDENAHVIQKARHQARQHDFRVRDADVLGHDEAGGAMTGGISCPPVEAQASTAPANSGG